MNNHYLNAELHSNLARPIELYKTGRITKTEALYLQAKITQEFINTNGMTAYLDYLADTAKYTS